MRGSIKLSKGGSSSRPGWVRQSFIISKPVPWKIEGGPAVLPSGSAHVTLRSEHQGQIRISDQIWASLWENRSSGFPTRSDTNRAVQPQNMARGWKLRIQEVEGLYYPCSENKGADQLRGYREADLRLCFRICKKQFFSRRGSSGLQEQLTFVV